MAFKLYFRTEDKGAPYQQIFTTSTANDELIASQLMKLLPPAPEPGVFRASFRPKGGDGEPEVSIEKVAESDQSVALVYAHKDQQGKPTINNVHLDPASTRMTADTLLAFTSVTAKELAGRPINTEMWIFLAL